LKREKFANGIEFSQRGRKRAIDGVTGSLVRDCVQKREKQEHLTASNAPVFPVFAENLFSSFSKLGMIHAITEGKENAF